jgi:hypothetical protein
MKAKLKMRHTTSAAVIISNDSSMVRENNRNLVITQSDTK